MIVLHYTGMKTGAEAIDRLADPAAKVSAHYVVSEDGQITHMVPEEKRAWHAGASHWRGISDVNSASVGIEIVNPGHEWGYVPFPAEQVASVVRLVHLVKDRHAITRGNRSEEPTSELQSLMRISYAVFCLKKKTNK